MRIKLNDQFTNKFKDITNIEIHNKSTYNLSLHEKIVLGLGVKFLPVPKITKLELKNTIYEQIDKFKDCTVLYCTVLYCTVLYCTVLYCTVHLFQLLCTAVITSNASLRFSYSIIFDLSNPLINLCCHVYVRMQNYNIY